MSIEETNITPAEGSSNGSPNYLRRRRVALSAVTGLALAAVAAWPLESAYIEKASAGVERFIHRDDPVCRLAGIAIVERGGSLHNITESANWPDPEGNPPFVQALVDEQYMKLRGMKNASIQPGTYPGIECERFDEATEPTIR